MINKLSILLIMIIVSCNSLKLSRYFYVSEDSCEYLELNKLIVDTLIRSNKKIEAIEKLVDKIQLNFEPIFEIWLTSYVEGYPESFDNTHVIFIKGNRFYFARINHIELIVSFVKINNDTSKQISFLVKENKPLFYKRKCDGVDGGGRDVFYVKKNGGIECFFESSLEGCVAMDEFFPITNDWSKVIDLIFKL